MVLLVFKDGTGELQTIDKLELQVSTLIEQNVEKIFVAKNLTDIKAYTQVIKDN